MEFVFFHHQKHALDEDLAREGAACQFNEFLCCRAGGSSGLNLGILLINGLGRQTWLDEGTAGFSLIIFQQFPRGLISSQLLQRGIRVMPSALQEELGVPFRAFSLLKTGARDRSSLSSQIPKDLHKIINSAHSLVNNAQQEANAPLAGAALT